ncbi:female protein-like [Fundulus heteroclitus]|uniref:female protein-like n=1 Tax=Fundulus heteroclitus TaxID=8078 RepID=UPI00165C52E3|nr:female protein-like [Fundulus heteroclitus]
MKLLVLLAMLTACAEITQDLSGKMLIFPVENNTTHVKLETTKNDFNAVTVCQRSFTDLQRPHPLFSLSMPTYTNGFMVMWDDSDKEMEIYPRNTFASFGKLDYKQNAWHFVCTTRDSASGLVQVWLDGRPSTKKFTSSGSTIKGNPIIILGQVKFDIIGMMSDVHMWDYILSPCEIQKYVDE